MQNRLLAALLCGLYLSLVSCGSASDEHDALPLADLLVSQAHAATAGGETAGESKKAARPAGERPLPGFEGRTVDGGRLSISSLIGKRLLLFFFNPEDEPAAIVAQAVADVAKQEKKYNFNVVGVGVGSTPATLRTFTKANGLTFPVIDDSDARITAKLRLPGRLLIIGADAEGYVNFFIPGFNTEQENAVEALAGSIRESLRIPNSELTAGSQLIEHPEAPHFETKDINGKPFDLATLDGRAKIVMFFLHTCPHCHSALEFFKKQLPKIPEATRPALVAISLQNRPSSVRASMAELDLDFFVPLVDPGGEIALAYGANAGVPDISLVDASGHIIYRMSGWRDKRDPALMRMYLARVSGEKVPFLLSREGYSGNDTCGACHELETATWELTQHARAYDTLVTHGQERDAECVSCHVVGFDQPGGYSFAKPARQLENVGCESCHGRGGPHLSPDFSKANGYAPVCGGCHDKKHSLGFEFASFRPEISHTTIASMTPTQRATHFGPNKRKRALLPTKADYVGSDACQSCHASEFETWVKSPHAHALTSLATKGKTKDGDCLQCHTTGYDLGGFPKNGDVNASADLARVGCESCHGPGGDHVEDDAKKLGSILSLGDKCDSCVILKICGDCHDEANDPDFEFEVQPHIDRQRHGTIEAGTGKPLDASASHAMPRRLEAEVADALRLLDGRS